MRRVSSAAKNTMSVGIWGRGVEVRPRDQQADGELVSEGLVTRLRH